VGGGSVGNPDPHFLGLQDPDLLVRGPEQPFSHKGVEQTEIMLVKYDFYTTF
jgi:hypothetical protein